MEPRHNTQNRQLASILQNLAQFTQPAIQSPSQFLPDPKPLALSPEAHKISASSQPSGSSLAAPTQDPRERPLTLQAEASKITEWSPAVKYVMNVLSKDPETSSKIKRLIKNQHDNERQWWAGREALITKHKSRVESKKKADDLLRSLGAVTVPTAGDASSTAAEEEGELQRYDKKVYAALSQMVGAMDRELRMLRVPFFAIKHDLVQTTGSHEEGVLTKTNLLELQRKMLQLLEDLFAD